MNKTLADTWQGCKKDKTQVIVEYGNYFNSFKDDDDDDLLMFELFFYILLLRQLVKLSER